MTASSEASQAFVRFALSIGAIELVPEGRTLKSGRISPYFFNSGLFNSGKTITHLANAYATTTFGYFCPEVLYGPAYKGIPLATAVAMAFYGKIECDLGYVFNRKEVKDHGDGGILVGASLSGKRVLILDDVMTTGTSSGEAVENIRAHGGIPTGCVIAFDRQEKGRESDLSAVQEFQNNYGVPVRAAATLDDLISVLQHTPPKSEDDTVKEILEKILAYKQVYGI